MKKRVLSLLLALALSAGLAVPAWGASAGGEKTEGQVLVSTLANGAPVTEENVLAIIESFRSKYPDRSTYDAYEIYRANFGRSGIECAKLTYMMSDEIFGELPVRRHTDWSNLRVGDIVVDEEKPHRNLVIALPDEDGYWRTVDGNAEGIVRWDRKSAWSVSEVQAITDSGQDHGTIYIMTRYPDAPFYDVPSGSWAAPYVERAVANGWVSGTGNGRYSPSDQVTYGQFAAMLLQVTAQGGEIPVQTSPDSPWWTPYMDAASNLFRDTQAAGDPSLAAGAISRYDMALVLQRCAERVGIAVPRQDGQADPADAIPDMAEAPEHLRDAVALCYALGLLSGVDSAGSFDGSASMTRAQAAAVLCALADCLKN